MATIQLIILVVVAIPLLRLLAALAWPGLLKRIEGQRTESMLVSQFGEIREDPLLAEVGARLLAARPAPVSFGVLSGPLHNAVALPHGRVLIWQGLLDEIRGDRDMLAGVVAHELGHLTREHFLARIQGVALARFVLGVLGGGWLRRALQAAATSVVVRGFSRHQELEADAIALDIMRAAGFNPLGLARVLERLALLAPQAPSSLLGTHPAPADRARRIRAALGLPAPLPLAPPPPLPSAAGGEGGTLPDNVIPFPARCRASDA